MTKLADYMAALPIEEQLAVAREANEALKRELKQTRQLLDICTAKLPNDVDSDSDIDQMAADLATANKELDRLRDQIGYISNRYPNIVKRARLEVAARAKLEEYQKLWDYYHEFCIEHGADDITDMAVKLGKCKRDASRYRWLRAQQWNKSNLFVVAGGKGRIKLSTDCPSLDRLDAAIDAALAQDKP